ncbi:MAG TPA: bifunctional isocitrate dehydrogenase kinase/phosphatase [Burkholderiaceae bacterium]|nr:bifunctional isocitrate dehydrogenase kinase/phosphatase [Burkholderiaceae bacterium]
MTPGKLATAKAIAQVILWGFNKHYRIFRETARQAKQRFEQADWLGMQRAASERIAFYDTRVLETVERLDREFRADTQDNELWSQIKFEYVDLLLDHKQPECAESFFNSVICKILHRDYYRNEFIFVRPTISTEYLDSEPTAYRSYYPASPHELRDVFREILFDADFMAPFANLERDLDALCAEAEAVFPPSVKRMPNHQVQVLSGPFFRNKGCYLIGKIINGFQEWPFAIALLHEHLGRLSVDTILFERDQILTLFSFARAYFFVDMEVPAGYVQFLRSVMPNKPKAELYAMVGLQKFGKTLFYRDFLHHLKHSTDQFVIAPGIKGLVMLVFCLPSFPYVFKVIKDRISATKDITREGVMQKYQLVKRHDRVGRMADNLEYSNVAFPRARFSQELIDELLALAPSMLEVTPDTVVVRHLYIERYMTPLNLYMQSASDVELERCLIEYGQAIKDLAAANIFPGDMLYKNFGVSRQGRVVFYDYDEIEYMTTCNFRRVPEPRTEEEAMASEVWYSVGRYDVFPEEFKPFLLGDPRVRAIMLKHHADLFTPEFWQRLKERIEKGHVVSVFPYPQSLRFNVRRRAEALPAEVAR